ncbi:Sensor protein FixL [Stieleria maiorica]|uniref:histidine kinase n=1 Tax=Stieleria maiorica TaxID=2795974 RepID=A0A5B9MGZ8_9BACT|nr:MASE1 domain-containing protein [Stieleria maiorica]QEF98357.1 Sensor protein FixL [Stieleria maiorica]
MMSTQSVSSPVIGGLAEGKKLGLASHLILIGALAAVYYATARAGLLFAIPPGNATAVWPPSGIALGGLLLGGLSITPGIWIGSFLVNTGTGVSPVTAGIIATGNTAAALVAFALCRRFLSLDAPFRRAACGFRLFAIAAVACLLAATLGSGSLAINGYISEGQFGSNWSTWWLGDLAGVMLLSPLFMLFGARHQSQVPSHALFGALVSLVVLGVISLAIFGSWLPEEFSEGLLYLPLIALFWLLLRFPPIVVFGGNLLIAVIAVHYTSRGSGPFATEVVANSLFELQFFMTVYALTTLALIGVLSSQREAENRESQLAAKVKADEAMRKKESELAHVARLATMGELVAGIAHEVNQPLYAIANYAAASESMLASCDVRQNDRLCDLNRQISDQAVRAGEIIRRMRGFVKKSGDQRTVFSISDAVDEACSLLDAEARLQTIAVNAHPESTVPVCVCADRIQIEQVFINLIRNAIDAMGESDGDKRVVTVRTVVVENEVQVSVIDRGIGITQSSLTDVFAPFFTTKQNGMGMGLAISRTIVEAHGGRIWASPGTDDGAVFTVALPIDKSGADGR